MADFRHLIFLKFLLTEGESPGTLEMPGKAGRKRRVYGLNYITNTCKIGGYLPYFVGCY
tara:strand:+ start:338 stop:514 length:177 start_codon:yes stop_codon:yes gene_type:complete